MPYFSEEELENLGANKPGPIALEQQDFSRGEAILSAIRKYSTPYQMYDQAQDPVPDLTEQEEYAWRTGQFDIEEWVKENAPHMWQPGYLEAWYDDGRSEESAKHVLRHLQEEERENQAIAEHPIVAGLTAVGVYGMEEAALTLVPGIRGAVYGQKAKHAGKIGAGLFGSGAAFNEYQRHQNQYLVSDQESLTNILATMAFTGAAAHVARRLQDKSVPKTEVEEAQNQSSSKETGGPSSLGENGGSVGAAYNHDYISQDKLDEILARTDLNDEEKILEIIREKAEFTELEEADFIRRTSLGTYRFTPSGRMLLGEDPAARIAADSLFLHDFATKGGSRGERMRSIEALAKLPEDTRVKQIMEARTQGFLATKKERASTGRADGKYTVDDFDKELQIAITKDGATDNPHVAKAAKVFLKHKSELEDVLVREKLLAPYFEDIRVGKPAMDPATGQLKAAGPKGSDVRHFTRVWNQVKIGNTLWKDFVRVMLPAELKAWRADMDLDIAERAREIDNRIADLELELSGRAKQSDTPMGQTIPDTRRAYDDVEDAVQDIPSGQADSGAPKLSDKSRKGPSREAILKGQITKLKNNRARLAQEVEQEYTDDITEHLRKMHDEAANGTRDEDGVSYYMWGDHNMGDGVIKFKQRTLRAATEDVMEFVAEGGIQHDLHSMNKLWRAVLLTQQFGDTTGSKLIQMSQDFWRAKMALEPDLAKRAKMRNKLIKNRKDIEDSFLAVQLKPVRTMTDKQRDIKTMLTGMNVLALLGRAVISATAEIPYAIVRPGVGRTIKTLSLRMAKHAEMENMKEWHREWVALGWESSQAVRLMQGDEMVSTSSRMANTVAWMSDKFLDKWYLGGLTPASVALRQQTAMTYTFTLTDAILNSKFTKKDLADFGRLGLTKDMVKSMRKEIKKHGGQIDKHTWNPRPQDWGNTELAQALGDAIHTEANNIVGRVSTGDRPFWTHGMAGAIMMQFTSYMLMSHNRMFMANMQRMAMGDMRGAQNLAILTVGGAMSGEIRNLTYSDKMKREQSLEQALKNGFAYGAGFSVFMEINDLLAEVSGGRLNAWNLLGFEDPRSSKYRGNRSILSTGLGPSAGIVEDVARIISGLSRLAADGEMTMGELNAIRRRIPGNNLYWAAPGFNQAVDTAFDAVGKTQ